MVSRFKDLPQFIQDRTKVSDSGCWLWQSSLCPHGYAYTSKKRYGQRRVHRVSYTLLVGQIPEGLVLDHLCRVKNCINPHHLEPVTDRENLRRGFALITACPQGHDYTPDNTYIKPGAGSRECRRCRADQRLRYKAKQAA
jgi:hypothetical protein